MILRIISTTHFLSRFLLFETFNADLLVSQGHINLGIRLKAKRAYRL